MSDVTDVEPTEAPDTPTEEAPAEATTEPVEPSEPTEAASTPEPADDGAEDPTEPPKKARGSLEPLIKGVTDAFVTKKFTLEEGQLLTPHRIATIIEESRDDGSKVSAGAVTATLSRWEKYGFAVLNAKPVAFVGYTDDAVELGLNECKARFRREQKAKKEAEKNLRATAAKAGEDIAS